MINDIEHLFIYLLAIHISSLEKDPFRPFVQFLIVLLVNFYYFSIGVPYIFLILVPYMACKYCLPLWVSFSFHYYFHCYAKMFSVWCSPTCLFLLLLPMLWISYKKHQCRDLYQGVLYLFLGDLQFQVLCLYLSMYFELIFVNSVR
jgi:hypothetical protein